MKSSKKARRDVFGTRGLSRTIPLSSTQMIAVVSESGIYKLLTQFNPFCAIPCVVIVTFPGLHDGYRSEKTKR